MLGRQAAGFSTDLSASLAVVINKIDKAGLDMIIGEAVVKQAMTEHAEIFMDPFDTMDHICREFLKKMDMGNVLTHIQQTFKNNRFFATNVNTQAD